MGHRKIHRARSQLDRPHSRRTHDNPAHGGNPGEPSAEENPYGKAAQQSVASLPCWGEVTRPEAACASFKAVLRVMLSRAFTALATEKNSGRARAAKAVLRSDREGGWTDRALSRPKHS